MAMKSTAIRSLAAEWPFRRLRVSCYMKSAATSTQLRSTSPVGAAGLKQLGFEPRKALSVLFVQPCFRF
jgi:hypothetical protein